LLPRKQTQKSQKKWGVLLIPPPFYYPTACVLRHVDAELVQASNAQNSTQMCGKISDKKKKKIITIMKRRGVRKAAALLPDDPSRFQIFT